MSEQNLKPDLIYIDEYHNFDYVFTNSFYTDKLLEQGGVVGFNGYGWWLVYKVLRFLPAYRRYSELDVGFRGCTGGVIRCSR